MTHPDIVMAEHWLDERLFETGGRDGKLPAPSAPRQHSVAEEAEAILRGEELERTEPLDDKDFDDAYRHVYTLRELCRDEDEEDNHAEARRVLKRIRNAFLEEA